MRPCALAGTTATPATSGSVKAPSGPFPAISSAWLVRNTSAGSRPSKAASKAGSSIQTLGAASSAPPMRFSRRSISSAPVTTRVTASTWDQRAASASLRQAAGVAGKTRRLLEPASGKRVVQASSMVKGASGDSQMVRRSNTRSITVRAARRRTASGRSQ